MGKICSGCKLLKGIEAYSCNKYKRDGLSATCRDCEKSMRQTFTPPKGKTYQEYLEESLERDKKRARIGG